ncbi:MAG TPA: hypothetical protein VGX16_00350 [Solirubrobacteraceae bacterium]|jgi:hypothetical protein|nr:hypothetical protein [Solirubrobacteraceae bacterium]
MKEARLIEATLLILLVILLAVASVHDVARQVGVNHRLVADLRTWRQRTGHAYHELTIEQDIKGHSTRETVCGNTSPGSPDKLTQLCLTIGGPVRNGRRTVLGGYYLPPELLDVRANRYGCFGSALSSELCPPAPAPAPAAPSTHSPTSANPRLPGGRG